MSDVSDGLAIQDGQKVVFIGDSITDCGRRAAEAPLGAGYVSMAIGLMTARYPARHIDYVNRGIGGDVATGLRDRWDEDVLAHKPDTLSVLVGINDLHRTLRGDETAVAPDLYRQAYTECLTRTMEAMSPRLILMDPFYMCRPDRADEFQAKVLALIPEYIAIVTDLAEQFGATHVRLHEMYRRILEHVPAEAICDEPVHPNRAGHLMIAHEWLGAVGW